MIDQSSWAGILLNVNSTGIRLQVCPAVCNYVYITGAAWLTKNDGLGMRTPALHTKL